LIGGPRGMGFRLEALAGLLALDILADRLAHHPMGLAVATGGELLNAIFHRVI
jgi:hypothetical protein